MSKKYLDKMFEDINDSEGSLKDIIYRNHPNFEGKSLEEILSVFKNYLFERMYFEKKHDTDNSSEITNRYTPIFKKLGMNHVEVIRNFDRFVKEKDLNIIDAKIHLSLYDLDDLSEFLF